MPYPSEATVEGGRLVVVRRVDESGCLQVPWLVDPLGQFMTSSATLMERPTAYSLPVELARGKVNQLRGQAADWIMGGLQMPEALRATCSRRPGHSATRSPPCPTARPTAWPATPWCVAIGRHISSCRRMSPRCSGSAITASRASMRSWAAGCNPPRRRTQASSVRRSTPSPSPCRGARSSRSRASSTGSRTTPSSAGPPATATRCRPGR